VRFYRPIVQNAHTTLHFARRILALAATLVFALFTSG
jgi:hypothetical protein